MTAPGMQVAIATSNAGKRRDFAAVASRYGIEIVEAPEMCALEAPAEDAATFLENARTKAA